MGRLRAGVISALVLGALVAVAPVEPVTAAPTKDKGDDVAAHWTPARMKAATPRDLRVDDRGLAYLEQADGTLTPHGHSVGQLHASKPASKPTPAAKPGGGGGGDTTPPTISQRDPAADAVIGAAHTFSAKVTDASGIRSVSFTVARLGGVGQSFAASYVGGDLYQVSLQGFTDGHWTWKVTARDAAGKSGNLAVAGDLPFEVVVGGGGTPGDDVANAEWTAGGPVQDAVGRIYFEMPANSRRTRWNGYVCSGTVAYDETEDRSVIITAAHCVYDDVYKVFARNVMFIPNQAGTTAAGTDRTCTNDPIGCWEPTFGVVDVEWTTRTFPDNVPWDFAYYVVEDEGHHQSGLGGAPDALDDEAAAGSLKVSFDPPTTGEVAHALGYSYSDDPNFMYCSEPLGTEPPDNWWLAQCGLSGGSSGGPWVQPLTDGDGPIFSVNSWGYTGQPGMAGPLLHDTSAGCLFGKAKGQSLVDSTTVANRGVVVTTCT